MEELGANGSYQRWQALTVTGILATWLVGWLVGKGWLKCGVVGFEAGGRSFVNVLLL